MKLPAADLYTARVAASGDQLYIACGVRIRNKIYFLHSVDVVPAADVIR